MNKISIKRNTLLSLLLGFLTLSTLLANTTVVKQTNSQQLAGFAMCPKQYHQVTCNRIPCAYKIVCGCLCPDERCDQRDCRTAL